MARRDSIVRAEVLAARSLKPGLIVADIPFLAADVADEIGVPCVGVSNFTWDWIYENLFGPDPAYAPLAGSILRSYAKMTALLELPLGRTCPAIARKVSMPLIAMRSHRDRHEILKQLRIAPHDSRPRVLFGTRGTLDAQTLIRAAANAPEFLFLFPHEPMKTLPANAITMAFGPTLDFSDVLRVADVVVSKLGYGMISECIATQTRLVWPPRRGFVEDTVVEAQAPAVVPMTGISLDDYQTGRWGEALRTAMRLPVPSESMDTNGADACAEWLLRRAM